MMTLNDGRSELWQWDTGRKLTVDADCSQVHFSNKVFGRSIDVDVVDGVAIIPDILLQTDKELTAWAFVGTAENGYTKISKAFKVNRRNKPADYVFTPHDQTTLGEIVQRLEELEAMQDPDAIRDAVDDYLANNPIQIDEKDPTVPAWAKQPTKPKYTAQEVGAVATVNGISPDENGNVKVEAGGLSDTARALLITILRNGVYSTDQSANITALENALAGGEEEPDEPDVPDVPDEPEPIIYTITAELVNVTSSNSAASVTEGESYNATLTAAEGYEISTVTVLMGGVDVTADVYADGVIAISAVTGNVEIVASAIEEEKPAELPTDGLLAYFDLRNASAEKVGTATGIPTPTLGNGSLFSWASNAITSADDYGAVLPRVLLYDAAGGTSQTNLGTEFTYILLTRNGVATKQNGFAKTNVGVRWALRAKYNTSTGEADAPDVAGTTDSMADYNFQVTRVNGNALKLIFDTISHEFNGADYDDFVSWYSKPTAGTEFNDGTTVACAIYNRALTDVEIEEARAFMKTLEVA